MELAYNIGDSVRPIKKTLKMGKEYRTPAFVVNRILIREDNTFYYTNATNIHYTAEELEPAKYERSTELPYTDGAAKPKGAKRSSGKSKLVDESTTTD